MQLNSPLLLPTFSKLKKSAPRLDGNRATCRWRWKKSRWETSSGNHECLYQKHVPIYRANEIFCCLCENVDPLVMPEEHRGNHTVSPRFRLSIQRTTACCNLILFHFIYSQFHSSCLLHLLYLSDDSPIMCSRLTSAFNRVDVLHSCSQFITVCCLVSVWLYTVCTSMRTHTMF